MFNNYFAYFVTYLEIKPTERPTAVVGCISQPVARGLHALELWYACNLRPFASQEETYMAGFHS